MKVITVRFKRKFEKEYRSDEYSYKCPGFSIPLIEGDIVIVDTMYGLELAEVCSTRPTESQRRKATRWIRCKIDVGLKSREEWQPTVSDLVEAEPTPEEEVIW